jgi:hypothetical protein
MARCTCALRFCRATTSSIDSPGSGSDAISMTSMPSGAWTTGVRRSRRIQSRQRLSAMRYSHDENLA